MFTISFTVIFPISSSKQDYGCSTCERATFTMFVIVFGISTIFPRKA
jgi:hypothetical protein